MTANRLQYGHDQASDAAGYAAEMQARVRRIRELRAERFQAEDNGLFGIPDVAEARAAVYYTDRDEE